MGECKLPEMTVLDLGVVQAPMLVFGGAYSNLQALQAMLDMGRTLGIQPSSMIHTGDVVAYCAQPLETSELLKASGVHCLMGNCEESIGVGKQDCGCGFPEDSKCNEYSQNWYEHVSKELKGRNDLARWMGDMPRRIEFTFAGRRWAVVHGSPRGIAEFVWPSASEEELLPMFDALPHIDGIICGHSGMPFASFVRDARVGAAPKASRLWLNAGVLGMPANDGTKRGWYTLLHEERHHEVLISIRALEYNAADAAKAIVDRPQLVRGYADALNSGIWPSHDILPLDEQMATGVPLDEKTYTWRKGPKLSHSTRCYLLGLGGSVLALALTYTITSRRRAS